MKGLIALDIDGTISVEMQPIPQVIVDYLHQLNEEGWQFIFITGRTFQWGFHALQVFSFPYYFSVQNGAIVIEMPSRRIIAKKYLNRSIFPTMETICEGLPADFVIYSGFEYNDLCYYRSAHFSPELLAYLEKRQAAFKETWRDVNAFETLEIKEFPSIKYIGDWTTAFEAAQRVEKKLGLHVPVIKDPFCENYFVAQATHPEVNKGQAVRDLKDHFKDVNIIIAAGDDNNDRSMLAQADIKIVMSTAPQDMLYLADVIAPSAAEKGIILGLKKALERI